MKKLLLGVTLTLLLLPRLAAGAAITMSFGETFSNNVNPGGSGPWLLINFNDATASAGNDIRITMTAVGLEDDEFISSVYLNILTQYPVGSFSGQVITDPNSTYAGALYQQNAYKADGDGLYDLLFNFQSADCCRFGADYQFVFDINLISGTLLLAQFIEQSFPDGGSGPFFGAAHLQGIAGDPFGTSTWIRPNLPPGSDDPPGDDPVVPEPATIAMMGTGLIAIAAKMRKRNAARKAAEKLVS
jgi:hypothetical protein